MTFHLKIIQNEWRHQDMLQSPNVLLLVACNCQQLANPISVPFVRAGLLPYSTTVFDVVSQVWLTLFFTLMCKTRKGLFW